MTIYQATRGERGMTYEHAACEAVVASVASFAIVYGAIWWLNHHIVASWVIWTVLGGQL